MWGFHWKDVNNYWKENQIKNNFELFSSSETKAVIYFSYLMVISEEFVE